MDESQKTIDWLKLSQMIVNPKKFHTMFICKKKNALPRNLKLQINNPETTSCHIPATSLSTQLCFPENKVLKSHSLLTH